MEKIPIFKLTFDALYRRRFQEGCEKIFDEGYLTNHTMVKKAEAEFKAMNESAYTLAVSSGTSALEVALKAIDVKDREVILPTNTFIATYLAIFHAGGIPVLADIENDYFSIDPEKVAEKISSRTKAVMIVHIGGHISPSAKKVKELCQKHGLLLIEDAAHAHFAELNGIKAGNLGDIGCFSFHMTKVVTSGEGGMITTSHKNIFERCVSVRQFGMDLEHQHSHIYDGSNYKLGEFNALAMVLDLERSSARIEKRKAIGQRYQKNLSRTLWKVVQDNSDTKGSFYKQIILPPPGLSRDEISRHLNEAGISLTNGVYYQPLHRQPFCQQTLTHKNFPVSDDFSDRHICPPCYPELEFHEVDRICEVLLKAGGDR